MLPLLPKLVVSLHLERSGRCKTPIGAELKSDHPTAFFERGRRLAGLADEGRRVPQSVIVAFGEAAMLLRTMSPQRLLLLQHVKAAPASITDLAKRLSRDRSATARDVQVLERAGILKVTRKPLAGHGRMKWVSPMARQIQLTARI